MTVCLSRSRRKRCLKLQVNNGNSCTKVICIFFSTHQWALNFCQFTKCARSWNYYAGVMRSLIISRFELKQRNTQCPWFPLFCRLGFPTAPAVLSCCCYSWFNSNMCSAERKLPLCLRFMLWQLNACKCTPVLNLIKQLNLTAWERQIINKTRSRWNNAQGRVGAARERTREETGAIGFGTRRKGNYDIHAWLEFWALNHLWWGHGRRQTTAARWG